MSHSKKIWMGTFIYWNLFAAFFQKVLLPFFPNLHAGQGLIKGDAVYFHLEAVKYAQILKENGLGALSLNPAMGGFGNLTLLGLVYRFFGANPLYYQPINAFLQATSALVLYQLVKRLDYIPHSHRQKMAFFSLLLFLLFPSAVIWATQFHKDSYAILGWLCLFYAWSFCFPTLQARRYLLFQFLGCLLILFVRPFYIHVIIGLQAISCLIILTNFFFKRKKPPFSLLACLFIVFLGQLGTYKLMPKLHPERGYFNPRSLKHDLEEEFERRCHQWRWQKSSRFLHVLDKRFETLARIRAVVICHYQRRAEAIDLFVMPQSLQQVLLYLPKALLNAVLSPFPQFLLKHLNAKKYIALLENIFWYLLLFGMLYKLKDLFFHPLGAIFIVCALAFFSSLGVMTPYFGNIHRLRFPFQVILMPLGLFGLFSFLSFCQEKFLSYWSRFRAFHHLTLKTSGLLFVGLSLNFMTELILIKKFGPGAQMDLVYFYVLIPRFLTMAIATPLGHLLAYGFGQNFSQAKRLFFQSSLLVLFLSFSIFPLASKLLLFYRSDLIPEYSAWAFLIGLLTFPLNHVIAGLGAYLNNHYSILKTTFLRLLPMCISFIGVLFFSSRFGPEVSFYAIFLGQFICCIFFIQLVRHQPPLSKNSPDVAPPIKAWPFIFSSALLVGVLPAFQYFFGRLGIGLLSLSAFSFRFTHVVSVIMGSLLSYVYMPIRNKSAQNVPSTSMLLIALSKLVPFIFILAALMASLFSQFLKNETSENVFAFIFVSLCMAPLHFLLMLQQNEGLLRSKKSSFFALAFLVFFFLTGIYFSETSQINTKTLLTLLVVLYTSMVTVSLIFVPLSRQKSTYLLFPSLYSALVFFCFNSSKPLLSSIMTGGFLFLLKFLATQVTFKEKASHV